MEEAAPETDAERFHTIPDIGIGVVGKYRGARDMESATPSIIVRQSVYERLCAADRALKQKPGYGACQLVVTYGYRSPALQIALWNQVYTEEAEAHPEAKPEELRELAHRKFALPEVAGHPTGGTIDVIIFDYEKGEYLDFGTESGDLTSTACYYASALVDETAREHRRILREVMCKQGFAPYDGEWWHFSYGDKEWAYYYYRLALREAGDSDKILPPPRALYRQKDFEDAVKVIATNDKYKPPISENQLRIRLAIQKEGRLTEETLSILSRSGISVTKGKTGFLAKSGSFPLDVIFVRDDDISNLVDAGVADIGIVGENVYFENRSSSVILRQLGFGKCFLGLAVPEDSPIRELEDLRGRRIATSHHVLTRRFLEQHGLKALDSHTESPEEPDSEAVRIIDIAGSVEVAPLINYADAIVDLVSTGSSIRQNKLRLLEKFHILDSESILIGNREAVRDFGKKALIDRLTQRLDSYLRGRQKKLVTMNVPADRCEALCSLLLRLAGLAPAGDGGARRTPGAPEGESPERQLERMRSCQEPLGQGAPTVLPVWGFENWRSVRAVLPLSRLWENEEAFRELGAVNITFSEVEGVIL